MHGIAISIFEPAPDWFDQGICHGRSDLTAAFFPETGTDGGMARRLCANCPVCDECLDYALDEPETHGIWGGKSERERRALRRNRPPRARPIMHGTSGGYDRCRELNGTACAACTEAKRSGWRVHRAGERLALKEAV